MRVAKCPECRGAGTLVKSGDCTTQSKCWRCRGAGVTQFIQVDLPPQTVTFHCAECAEKDKRIAALETALRSIRGAVSHHSSDVAMTVGMLVDTALAGGVDLIEAQLATARADARREALEEAAKIAQGYVGCCCIADDIRRMAREVK